MEGKDKKKSKLTPDEIKDRAASAIEKLDGARFILSVLSDENGRKAIMHNECSPAQMALMIKGMLMTNRMLLLDVMEFCARSVDDANKNKGGLILN